MTNPIIERAARALCEARGEDPHGAILTFPSGTSETPIDAARRDVAAVIRAIREPSEAMISAGQMVIDGARWEEEAEQSQIAWQAMIAAAQGEG